jgi:hypothetical protein
MPFVVQFPHPGSEHRPVPPRVGTVMPWNRGPHKRKFLAAPGDYLLDGALQQGSLAFWGEWEPQSVVVDAWPKEGRKPRFLHEPLYEAPPEGVKHQNTDPLVFGESFLYTNCKQITIKKLQRLTPGSLILFGSGQGHGFVLDTVFVVGGDAGVTFEIGERSVVPHRPEADALVFRPLSTSTRNQGKTCRAYSAASYSKDAREMFSYVPCRPDGADVRFERPLLEPIGALEGLITLKLKMGARVNEVEADVVVSAWHHVRAVVEAQGLALGVHLPPPASTMVGASAGAATEAAAQPSSADVC